ncbi:MAG: peptide chain release factor N(5)-glutamine methyltransferase [Thiolinea sp.]
MQIREAIQQASKELAVSSASARLDAELLLGKVLEKNRSYLFAWPEKELSAHQQTSFQSLLEQRMQGVPIAYLLGYREFWGMELEVTPATLIPRPDTELLVQLALERIADQAAPSILDLGTGTGAIALALAKERPDASVLALDKSDEALAVAKRNQQRLGLANLKLLASDWFSVLPKNGCFDLIVANPPYISEADPHLSQGDVRFEPRSALISGLSGLDDLSYLIQTAPQYLAAKGWLLLEHGYDQGLAVTERLIGTGYTEVACYQDLAGNDRVSLGYWSS